MAIIDDQAQAVAEPAAPSPLLTLFNQLAAAFEAEKSKGYPIDNTQPAESFYRLDCAVQKLIGAYIQSGSEDWQRYVHFNKHHYVRNLVDANDDLELLVLCWEQGQVSRIHDHHQAHGYVTVLDGAVEEKRFRVAGGGTLQRKDSLSAAPPTLPGVITATTPCPELEEIGSAVAKRGEGSLYINDHIALHSVGCVPGSGVPAVTLHLYAPPIRRVQLFEPDNDRVVERKPGYYSVRGQRV